MLRRKIDRENPRKERLNLLISSQELKLLKQQARQLKLSRTEMLMLSLKQYAGVIKEQS